MSLQTLINTFCYYLTVIPNLLLLPLELDSTKQLFLVLFLPVLTLLRDDLDIIISISVYCSG